MSKLFLSQNTPRKRVCTFCWHSSRPSPSSLLPFARWTTLPPLPCVSHHIENPSLRLTFVSFSPFQSLVKVSMLSLAQHAIVDCFICLTHLLIGLVAERWFNSFALLAFLNFMAFSIFEMRYLLMVWKARRPQSANNSFDSVRNELSVLYLQFCTSKV